MAALVSSFDMAKLFVLTKGLAVSSHELGADWVTIGRGDSNHFQVVEPSISGRHCEVRVKDGALTIRDLLSTNGTFVEGKKVAEAVVKSGNTFRLGDVEFRFEPTPPSLPGDPPAKQAAKAAPSAKSAEKTQNAQPAPRFHVLLVDDSLAFLEAFSELCGIYSEQTWQVDTASTADRALALLQETQMDLAVLDIGMPMVDGIQLLGIIHKRYPGLKIAVMTGNASEANRTASLANGAELFIEKPVSSDGSKVVFNLLHDLVSWVHREGFSGALRQVGLQEVVQMECVGNHSSILEIRNSELRGQIYIEAGAIIHAAVGKLEGQQAFHRLLSLKGGEFQVKTFQAPPQRTVNDRWEMLLMDAARANDEETVMLSRASLAPTSPAKAAAPVAAPVEPSGQASAHPGAHGDDFVVVATYDGQWIPTDGSKQK